MKYDFTDFILFGFFLFMGLTLSALFLYIGFTANCFCGYPLFMGFSILILTIVFSVVSIVEYISFNR